jgi:hypothetical protein
MTDRPLPDIPDDDWGAELFEPGGIEEPTLEERRRRVEEVSAKVVFDRQTIEALTLLAFAVDKLGGSLVLSKEEMEDANFALQFDNEYSQRTGGIRVYVHRPEPA